MDELPHLASGIAHWKTNSFELYRVNPPLVRSVAAIPVLVAGADTESLSDWRSEPFDRPEFSLGRSFVEANGARSFFLFTLARWSCLPFLLLGGYVSFRWGRELYGPAAGFVSLTLWSVCPNLIAWGATICPDAPAAALGLWAGYTFWLWIRRPSWRTSFLAGAVLGLALLTKSTWLVLLGVWPAVWFASRFSQSSNRPSGRQLICILFVSIYLLNLGYAFSGSFRRLGEFEFISHSLSGQTMPDRTGNRFRNTILKHLPLPLPADFVIGLDQQQFDFEQGRWSYLRGEQKRGGWWYYYLYALAVKTPIGTLLLVAFAFVAPRLAPLRPTTPLDSLIILAPALTVLAVVSSYTGFNRYLRYVLPAIPFLIVWAGRAGCVFSPLAPRTTIVKAARCFVLACLAASAASSLWTWPHSMSYFNELVGGPRHGHRHLLDANIDWGQDLLRLKQWMDAHPEAQPLHVTFFGWVHPRIAGIDAPPVPRLLFNDQNKTDAGTLAQVTPGWYAVSVNYVTGYRHSDNNPPLYQWLTEFEPVARVGYSIWIYQLSEGDVQQFRARH